MIEDSDEALAARRVGTMVGNWTILSVLGIGGMASVFLAQSTDGMPAAVKVLHPYLSDIPELRKRFMREGPISNALLTLNPLCEEVVQVYETGVTDDGAAFIAMEVLTGETAFDLFAREGLLSVRRVLRIAEKVLKALCVAHEHGIIHRDLKPENVHIGALETQPIKVLDFGIARVLDSLPPGLGDLPEKTVTKTGVALGSGQYMAPEQALGRNQEVDGRTDLFGLGATMFHLLSGRYVHGEVADANLLIAAATRQAPPLASVAPHVPLEVCAVVDRSLRFRKDERYPDARTMRADVVAVRQGKPPPYAAARA